MGNAASRPLPSRRRSSAPVFEPPSAPSATAAAEAEHDYAQYFSEPPSVEAPSYAPSVKDSDNASIAETFISERTLTDNVSLYSTTGTVLDESVIPPSGAIRSGMASAMEVLNGEKGWVADVANAQLEWLAQDAGRRARWLRAEVAMQNRRAKRGRRGSGLGLNSRRGSGQVFNLSLAGEDRAREEDAAVVRRLGMERMAGEHRKGAEELAKEILEGVLAEHRLPPPVTRVEGAGEERREREAEIRGLHAEARDQYHATCKEAAEAHATALENAKIAHAKAYSAAKVRYMGATLRAPQLPTGATSMREASVGPIFE